MLPEPLVALMILVAVVTAFSLVPDDHGLAAARRWRLELQRHSALARALKELGLRGGWRSIGGVKDGFQVTARPDEKDRQVVVEIEARRGGTGIPPWFGLRCAAKPGPHRTGDAPFDRVVAVDAPAEAIALLDRKVRRSALAICAKNRLEVSGGRLVLRSPGSWTERSAPELKGLITSAVHLAARLSVAEDELPRRLRAVATADTEPGVRARCLEALGARFPGHEEGTAAARALLDDPDPAVRLAAGALLGEEGFGALRDLVLAGKPVRVAARALAHLAQRLPPGRVAPLLRVALGSPGSSLRLAALRALAGSGDAGLEADAARRLAAPSSVERRAAVLALAAIGTAASVPPLRDLGRRTRALDFTLRREIQGAVARIHSRLDGAAAGQVALAGGGVGGGEVSLAHGTDGAAGRLSAATEG